MRRVRFLYVSVCVLHVVSAHVLVCASVRVSVFDAIFDECQCPVRVKTKKNIDVIPSTSQGFVSEAERRLSLQCIVPAFANLATDTLPPRNPFGRFAGIQLVA